MTGRLRTSRAGLELIKSFEGFRDSAVRLPDGRWTIGYGHVRTAREGLTITKKDADELLVHDLKPVEDAVHSMVFAPINQNQFDALVSLASNISPGRFKDSQTLRNLNAGDFLNAASGFDVWRKARINGRVMVVDALVRRRAAEKAMFLEHPDGRPTAPTPLVTPEADTDIGENSQTPSPSEAAQQSQPANPTPAGSDQSARRPSVDIAEAVRRLAERTNEIAAAAGQRTFPMPVARPGPSEEAESETEPHVPPRTTEEIEKAHRSVAERISRILERAEQSIADEQAAQPGARPVGQSSKSATSKPAEAPGTLGPNGRPLIDDTETFDPGRDPAALFAEGEQNAKIVNGRAKRLGLLNLQLVALAPWIFILVLSVLGFGIGVVNTLSNGDGGVMRSAPTVLAMFGMMMLMSVYFIITRSTDSEG
jgi:GH24 family phage-related lysozyme (muramidase)